MKRIITSLIAAWALLLPFSATAADKLPHRLVYGYFLANDDSNLYGLGRFYMDNAQEIEFLDYANDLEGIFAGACADGIMYYMEYEYSLTEGPIPSGFYSYDLTSGKKEKLGDYSTDTTNPYLKCMDMTYDYSTKTMYAVGYEMGAYSLYTIDLSNGHLTKTTDLKVSLNQGMGTLACNKEGQLYGLGIDGVLYKIDKQTGNVSQVVNLGHDYAGMVYSQSMDFDHTNGQLYWAARPAFNDDMKEDVTLVRLDLTKTPIQPENLTVVGRHARLQSLFVTFVEDGDDAPAAPTNLTIIPASDGSEKATISWKNPTTTFIGDPLQDLKSVTIMRGDEVVTTLNGASVGAEMSFVDDKVSFGSYRYVVFATNSVGNGDKAYKNTYIGNDCPAAVSNINVKVEDGCQSATITWEAPTTGYHDGYFTQNGLRYNIIRYPDESQIASNLTATTFTDNALRRLGRYYYEVIAVNDYGQTGQISRRNYVLGKAVDVTEDRPLMEDFSDMTFMYNQWSPYDGNHDAYGWTYNTLAPSYQFRTSSTGAEYFINPGIPHTGNDADEWIVSPPFNVKQGHTYQFAITARSMTNENIEITTGRTNEIEDQQKVGDITVIYDPSTDNGVSAVLFYDYSAQLPTVTEDGILCAGLHLVTPYPTGGYSMIQISNITISDITTTGIHEIVSQGQATMGKKRGVWTVDGRYVSESEKAFRNSSAYKKGLYIINGRKAVVR